MFAYRHREYKAGRTIEVIETYPGNCGRGLTREKYKGVTPPAMARYNEKMQVHKLTRLINANFIPDDLFITLHYNRQDRPTPETAKAQLSAFLRKLKALYKKNGGELKYIKVSAYGSKGGIHHHIVVNNIGLNFDLITALWKFSTRKPDFTPLYDNGEYSALAAYLIKQSKITKYNAQVLTGRTYSGSHNLKQPELIKDEYIERIKWNEPPKAKKGYLIDTDSIEAGINELTGKPYLFYRMIKEIAADKETRCKSRADNRQEVKKRWGAIAPLGDIVFKKELTKGNKNQAEKS
ncbi:MAG: hypothetical protein E7562_05545 [Ruminococcaceae bacterium]|nr:hypothetical protein [Oscillospiraceae bacterium]